MVRVMKDKEKFDFYSKTHLIKQSKEDRIKENVNTLIQSLYKPIPDAFMKIFDSNRFIDLGVDPKEMPILGDLKCLAVLYEDEDSYTVLIDKTNKGDVPSFNAYIEKYMFEWGWNIKVDTE